MELEFNIEKFKERIIKKKELSVSNYKIIKQYTSELYQNYIFEFHNKLSKEPHFQHKESILSKFWNSFLKEKIMFLLKLWFDYFN